MIVLFNSWKQKYIAFFYEIKSCCLFVIVCCLHQIQLFTTRAYKIDIASRFLFLTSFVLCARFLFLYRYETGFINKNCWNRDINTFASFYKYITYSPRWTLFWLKSVEIILCKQSRIACGFTSKKLVTVHIPPQSFSGGKCCSS